MPKNDSAPSEGTSRALVLTVAPEHDHLRLDKFVVLNLPHVGRKAARELFEQGRVRVAGRIARKSQPSRTGDIVEIALPEPLEASADPSLPLAVRLETPELVIVSKPAGQPTAPVPGSVQGTLVSALLARYPEMRGVGYSAREPGIVHRLDTGTSGLVLAARTAHAFERLKERLSAGLLQKHYLAIVDSAGLPGGGIIDSPLMPHPRDPRRMCIAGARAHVARPAETRWQTLSRKSTLALVEARVARARRHQIRLHLSSIGHPIVGDALYGGRAAPALGGSHALHASYLAWEGDSVLPGFSVEEPLRAEMRNLLDAD